MTKCDAFNIDFINLILKNCIYFSFEIKKINQNIYWQMLSRQYSEELFFF